MGLMNINGMGEMFEMYGTSQMMDMGMKMRFPPNVSPIGNPGPFGVLELGGMFTVFKVRDQLTSYADPGWYQHPPGTVTETVKMDMPHQGHMEMIHGMQHEMKSTQNPTQDQTTVSWFSREENQREHIQEGMNWMQSKPEDSMGGHMHHHGQMPSMDHMQHMEH